MSKSISSDAVTLASSTIMPSWLWRPGYLQGITWWVLSMIISNSNDIITKSLGTRFDGFEIAFFRFFFAMISLLPFVLRDPTSLKTSNINLQVIRALLLFVAVSCWSYGVTSVPLTMTTTMSFTIPLFVLPLAAIILKEKVGWQRWAATLVGFFGILVIAHPKGTDLEPAVLLFLGSSLMFAMLDVINKKILIAETRLAMLFYSALGTTIAGLVPALLVWQTPTMVELALLAMLGIGGNLILYCILQAFSATEISALAPFRYIELVFSTIFGFLIFAEIPTAATVLGALIIIPSTFYIVYHETRKKS